jgi:hypothetical protein
MWQDEWPDCLQESNRRHVSSLGGWKQFRRLMHIQVSIPFAVNAHEKLERAWGRWYGPLTVGRAGALFF